MISRRWCLLDRINFNENVIKNRTRVLREWKYFILINQSNYSPDLLLILIFNKILFSITEFITFMA